MNKETARQNLQLLIDKYYALTQDDKKTMREADVLGIFVEGLLGDVLGFPVKDPLRYKREFNMLRRRPDITVKLDSDELIFVEAKDFGVIEPLQEARYTIRGVVLPNELALPGMAKDRTAEEQQAINYAFESGWTWAILTNFERLRLFNARRDWLVLSFENPGAYKDSFDELWENLAYENIVRGSLNRISNQRWTKDIDGEYLDFINEQREILAHDLWQNRTQNAWLFDEQGQIRLRLLRDVVQRFLDRLVVVRFAEDHYVLANRPLYQLNDLVKTNEYAPSFNELLHRFFREFDTRHNSTLFALGTVDSAFFSKDALVALVDKLYRVRYRSMTADILGNTYEQYLGKALTLDNGVITTRDNLETRKKQGSYYTPQIVVRYIIDRTLGRYLYATEDGKPNGTPLANETRKTSKDITNLHILDAACGSGSFLLEAYYVLADFYEREIKSLSEQMIHIKTTLLQKGLNPLEVNADTDLLMTQVQLDKIRDYPRLILERHLYGVDLDPQAAEIGAVNLMLRALERKGRDQRLPLILNQNVKVGNGLVGLLPNDPQWTVHRASLAYLRRLRLELLTVMNTDPRHDAILDELAQIRQTLCNAVNDTFATQFGDLERVNPFHWGVEFPEVFYDAEGELLPNGGFTVIVGNPPYGGFLDDDEKTYFNQHYQLRTTDTAALFMHRFTQLSDERGIQSAIIPKPFMYASTWKLVREKFLDGMRHLVDCGRVWKDVKLEQVIYQYEKSNADSAYEFWRLEANAYQRIRLVQKNEYQVFDLYIDGVSDDEIAIAKHILEPQVFMGQFLLNTRGKALQSKANIELGKQAIGGKNIQPYHISGFYGYLDDEEAYPVEARVQTGDIVVQNIVAHVKRPLEHIKIIATSITPDEQDLIILDTVNRLRNQSLYHSDYWLGILTSRLVAWYVHRFLFAKAIRTMHFDKPITDKIPVPMLDLAIHRALYDKIIHCVNILKNQSASDAEHQKARRQLNETVFALYGLSPQQAQLIHSFVP